ncbi:MAG: serine/threonine-protein kinase [Gemmatimonadaceae bacterium]
MTPPAPDDATDVVLQHCRHCGAPQPLNSSFCSKCGATSRPVSDLVDPLRDKLQQLLGNELEVERELGRGGMAAVYAAFDPALQRRVAVKVLLPEIADDHGMADRFLREARTVASLQHPNVVTVYGVRSGEGVQAIVMQFVEGRSLDVVLAERGRLPLSITGLLLAQAAEGLQHAHDRGVVHRDVKPANVLIDREGRAVVSDFGIARRDKGPRTTATGMVVGTWAYMSPEQRSAQTVTPATDQYAFGVMAFELLTGQLPFNGSAIEMLHAHMTDPVPSLRALRPELPAGVEAIVQKMLAKAPAERWPSLREAEKAFRAMVADEGQTTLQMAALTVKVPGAGTRSVVIPATARAPRAQGTQTVQAPAVTPPEQVATKVVAPRAPAVAARSRAPLIIGAVVVIGALGALGAWVAIRPKPAPAPAVAANSEAPAVERPGAGQAAASAVQSAPVSTEPPGTPMPAPLANATPNATPGQPAPQTQDVAPPRSEPAAPAAAAASTAHALPAYGLADARRLGREFVTLLNQRRSREVAQFSAMGGDAAARAELLKLTESATDFAAGFDRVPAAPEEWDKGFVTEFHVDLEWKGGARVVRIRLYASPADGAWRTVGFAADAP